MARALETVGRCDILRNIHAWRQARDYSYEMVRKASVYLYRQRRKECRHRESPGHSGWEPRVRLMSINTTEMYESRVSFI